MSLVSSMGATAETALDFLCLAASHFPEAAKVNQANAGDKRRRNENSLEAEIAKVGSEVIKNKRPFRPKSQSRVVVLSTKPSMGSRSGTFLNLPDLVASSSQKIDVESSLVEKRSVHSKIIEKEKPKRKVSPFVPKSLVHLFECESKPFKRQIGMPVAHLRETLYFCGSVQPEGFLRGFQIVEADKRRGVEKTTRR